MAREKLDKHARKAVLDARKMMETIAKTDANEAETRRRVERMFDSLMGYDVFKHITREHAIHAVGNAEYCDFAIQLDYKESSRPDILVELKRVNVDLMPKHLKQAASYAINIGCEWVLLTNGREWKLYHVSFGQPPQPKLVDSWNLMNDEPTTLVEKFSRVGYRNVKSGGLARLWEKSNVLSAQNFLKVVLSEDSISLIRRGLKRATDVAVSPEEIVGGIRHLLNEASLAEMEKVKISLPVKKQSRARTISKKSAKKKDIAQSS